MAYPETLPDGATPGENGHVDDHNLIVTAVGNIDDRLNAVETASPTGVTLEQVQDNLGTSFLVAGTNITLTYNDAAGTLTVDSTGGGSMTREQIEDLLGASLVGFGSASVVYNDASNRFEITARSYGETVFGYKDAVAIATGKLKIYNDSGVTRTITSVRASVNTAPTGASLISDVNKGGTTIFGTQSARPTIAAAGLTNKTTGMTVTTWEDGTYLTCDVDQVGSTVAGSDLTVVVAWRV